MKTQMSENNTKTVLTSKELSTISGGVIPVAIWAIWGAATAAGFSGGVAVGLNYVNRH